MSENDTQKTWRVRLSSGVTSRPTSHDKALDLLDIFSEDCNLYELQSGKWKLIKHGPNNPYWEWPADVE